MIKQDDRYIPIDKAVREQREIFKRLLAEIDEGLNQEVAESKKRSYMTGPFWIIESIDGEVYDIHTPDGIDGFRSTYESALEQALKLANAEVERLRSELENSRL